MSELSEQAGKALGDALGAEHAALWVYGLANAFIGETRVRDAVEDSVDQHERLRDTAEQAMREAGLTPTPAQPAYDVGGGVQNQSSAIELLITAEGDCEVGWRSVLDNTEDPGLRRTALDGLTTSAARATRWRLTLGRQPAVEHFPGQR
ncbi:ferritin-like domain-containing protein [Saccharopolyspora sp. TS4A08]|uniref:Ferritin-like domain-containing protein n=1 Tax=Saccharopolyspora ipomoeae TaxID=3042027 RepID=A0ABT6PKA3_9PSEU|nr:ferritin-like domain-containing protein [Saccharopolyspora sp. TS4A08]MDI2028429.1 ferritin-like domain-containing protein [Saccharopolyspora sp. TS4A08]